jgi:hypothetical protein
VDGRVGLTPLAERACVDDFLRGRSANCPRGSRPRRSQRNLVPGRARLEQENTLSLWIFALRNPRPSELFASWISHLIEPAGGRAGPCARVRPPFHPIAEGEL